MIFKKRLDLKVRFNSYLYAPVAQLGYSIR